MNKVHFYLLLIACSFTSTILGQTGATKQKEVSTSTTQSKTGMLLINGVPVDTDKKGPSKPSVLTIDQMEFSKYKTTLILFSDNTYVVTQDNIATYLKSATVVSSQKELVVKQIFPINRIPAKDKIVSVLKSGFERTKLPFSLYPVDNPVDIQPVQICEEGSYYHCSWVYEGNHFVTGMCGCRVDLAIEQEALKVEFRDWMKEFM